MMYSKGPLGECWHFRFAEGPYSMGAPAKLGGAEQSAAPFKLAILLGAS